MRFMRAAHGTLMSDARLCSRPANAHRHSAVSVSPKDGGRERCGTEEQGWQDCVCHSSIEENSMSLKPIVAAAALAALTTPALAAEFYVVQDTTSKRCTIVEQKPTTSTTVVVGGGTVYTSRTEAETALRSVAVCSSGMSTGSTSTTTTTTTTK
jgi:hypothetical protein